MKIEIEIKKNNALNAGKDKYGLVFVDVPAADLNERQRAVLANECNWYKLPNGCDYSTARLVYPADWEPITEATADSVRRLLDGHVEESRRMEAIKAEKAAAEIAEAIKGLDDKLTESRSTVRFEAGLKLEIKSLRPRHKLDPSHPRYAEYESWVAELDAANAIAAAAAQAEIQAAKERIEVEENAAQEDRRNWIAEHGSERLKKCEALGIECEAIYRSERIAIELPEWEFDADDITTEHRDPRNPPLTALELLELARKDRPNAELIYYLLVDDAGDVIDRGYAAKDEYLGRTILLIDTETDASDDEE